MCNLPPTLCAKTISYYAYCEFSLAYANIYHTLTTLFMRFDLELVDTLRERDIDMVRDHFVAKPKRGSHGVIVRVSREF